MKTKTFFAALICLMALTHFAAQADTVDRIAAKVGNDIITVSDKTEVPRFKKKILTLKYGATEATNRLQNWQKDPLNEIILETLLKQKMAEGGIEISAPELEATYQSQWQSRNANEKTWIDQLQKAGLSVEAYKSDLRFEMQKQKFIQKNILPKISVADSELQAAYEQHKNEFQTFNKYRFTEVLLVQSGFSSESEFKKIAQDIHAGLKSGSGGIGALIQKYSVGAFKNSGGDSGVMTGADINPEIKSLLDHLNNGETSQIFFNSGQAFIFKLAQKSDPQILPFSQVAPALKMRLMESAIEDELHKYLMAEKDRTYIEIVESP